MITVTLKRMRLLVYSADSDFLGGGTNGKGHRIGYTYQLAKNLQGVLTYFRDEKGNDEHNYNRLQADLIFKF